jgi:hypothetical protein
LVLALLNEEEVVLCVIEMNALPLHPEQIIWTCSGSVARQRILQMEQAPQTLMLLQPGKDKELFNF